MEKVDKIPLGEKGHTIILGATETGKTYGTIKTLLKRKEGVLFFNTYHSEDMQGYIKADMNTPIEVIFQALDEGKKINLLPSRDNDTLQNDLVKVVRAFFKNGKKRNMFLVIDEAHRFTGQAKKEVVNAFTGGRHFFRTIAIVQRGAQIVNEAITESRNYVFFRTNLEEGYWESNYGIPLKEINSLIDHRDHVFCTYDLREVKGAYTIG